jgi:glutathione synthase/RimK-type ligase-like ATP-grasp enzyme
LPPHGLIVNAIGDADRSRTALRPAAEIAANARRPVVNAPAAVARTGRIANATRLAPLPGVTTPAVRSVSRTAPAIDAFPAILRVPGWHMGRAMIRVDDPDGLAAAAAALSGSGDLLAIDYVETRGAGGAWRKYRAMAIDGALYPLHLAIAHRWDVHYFSSAMGENAAYRAEEARFLDAPAATVGERAWAALGTVRDALGLDYAGVDFALRDDGGVVVFEANAAMTVIGPGDDPRFAYRKPASDAIAQALVRMFERRALP